MKHRHHKPFHPTSGPVAPPSSAPASPPPAQDVAVRAYFIYLSQGCPAGQDVPHWLEAEAQLATEARFEDGSQPPELL